MKAQSVIRRAVAAAFVAGSFAFGAAWAGPMDTAQSLDLTGSGNTVTGTVTGTVVGGSAVVFSFWANPTDVIEIDIDTNSTIDTLASAHGAGPTFTVERVQDDSSVFPFDPGSVSELDPLIQNWVPLSSGMHYVAVTMSPDRVSDSNQFLNLGGSGSGAFTLNVTCTRASTDPAAPPPCQQGTTTTSDSTDTPPPPPPPSDPTPPVDQTTGGDTTTPPATDVKYVNIDIRPNSRALVRLNPKWNAVIPVAILSGPGFNVRDVDASKLTFGHSGEEASLRNCNKQYTRWHHRHHHQALVCYFENAKAGFELGDEEGILKGVLKDGTPIEGRAMLRVLPEKRHYGHQHGRGHDERAENDRRGRR